jgi:transcriptional regulator with XRE-family HTH domain
LDKLEYQLNDHQSQLEVLSSAIADLQARVEHLESSQRKNSSVSGEALSKSRLGKLLGVSPSVISKWENGDIPSDKAAIKTQRAYETWRKEFTRNSHGKYHRKP